MPESWRDIDGYNGLYQVSDLGRVKSLARMRSGRSRWGGAQSWRLSERILTPALGADGYRAVILCKPGAKHRRFKVARLVAQAFLGVSSDTVNHKNAVKTDDRVENLEWATHLQNTRHAITMGLWNHRGGANGRAKLTPDAVREIRAALTEGESQTRIAKRYSVRSNTINAIATGKTWNSP